jgi:hypothetical protein
MHGNTAHPEVVRSDLQQALPIAITKAKAEFPDLDDYILYRFTRAFIKVDATKRFPSSWCASATKIVRPLESIAATQSQLQPGLLRLSAMISQYFNLCRAWNHFRRPAWLSFTVFSARAREGAFANCTSFRSGVERSIPFNDAHRKVTYANPPCHGRIDLTKPRDFW